MIKMRNCIDNECVLLGIKDYLRALFGHPSGITRLHHLYPNCASPAVFELCAQVAHEEYAHIHDDNRDLGEPFPEEKARELQAQVEDYIKSAPPYVPAPGTDELPPLYGSLWTTMAPADLTGIGVDRCPPMVVSVHHGPILDGERVIQVLPVCDTVRYAADRDLILPEGPTHMEMMIEMWNEQPICLEQLYRCVGVLLSEEIRLLMSCTGVCGASVIRTRGHTGDPIVSPRDVRLLFREIEVMRTVIFREPALRALDSQCGG